jgi:hypothetical protein
MAEIIDYIPVKELIRINAAYSNNDQLWSKMACEVIVKLFVLSIFKILFPMD